MARVKKKVVGTEDYSSDFMEEIAALRDVDNNPLLSNLTQHNNNQKRVEEALIDHLHALEELLDSLPDNAPPQDLSDSTALQLARVKLKLEKLIPTIVLDHHNLPLHPMRLKVLNLVKQAEDGTQPIPLYRRGKWAGDKHASDRNLWSNPVEYLELVFGAFLAKYNDQNEDYLYLDELSKISGRFRNTLDVFIGRHPEYGTLADYVPNKSQRLNKEAKLVLTDEHRIRQTKKYISLRKARG